MAALAHGDGRLVWGGVDLQAAWFGYSPTAVLLQATAAAIIVLGGLLLTMRVQPYAHTAQNRLEAGLSVAAAAFIFVGVFCHQARGERSRLVAIQLTVLMAPFIVILAWMCCLRWPSCAADASSDDADGASRADPMLHSTSSVDGGAGYTAEVGCDNSAAVEG